MKKRLSARWRAVQGQYRKTKGQVSGTEPEGKAIVADSVGQVSPQVRSFQPADESKSAEAVASTYNRELRETVSNSSTDADTNSAIAAREPEPAATQTSSQQREAGSREDECVDVPTGVAPEFTEHDGLERAQKLQEAGNRVEALQVYEEIVEAYPHSVHAPFRAGMMLRHLGRFDDAKMLLASALERMPENPAIISELARVAEAQENWIEALNTWRLMRQYLQGSHEPVVGMALALRRLGRLDEAEALLDEYQGDWPVVGIALERARLAEAREDRDVAHSRWTYAVEQFPAEWQVYVGMAAYLRAENQIADAEGVLLAGQSVLPGDPAIEHELANLRAMAQRGE